MKRNRLILLGLLLTFGVIACSSGDKDSSTQGINAFEQVRSYVDNWLSGISKPVLTADQVKAIIDDPNQAKNYQIVSVRKPEDYAKGHIKGAINIPFKDIAKSENIAKLNSDKKIITYCYTGHTGQMGMVALGLLGFDSINMKYGMMGWTDAPNVLNQNVFDCNPPDYPVETKQNKPSGSFKPPVILANKGESVKDIIQRRLNEYFSNLEHPVITADQVKAIIDDPNQAKNYQIVSVRKPEDYAKGHIKGAINIPWKEIAKPENLAKLDPNKKIITYCYTGHTGMIAAMVLNVLGYDAVDMKYGMMGWTSDSNVLNQNVFDCNPPNYPTEK